MASRLWIGTGTSIAVVLVLYPPGATVCQRESLRTPWAGSCNRRKPPTPVSKTDTMEGLTAFLAMSLAATTYVHRLIAVLFVLALTTSLRWPKALTKDRTGRFVTVRSQLQW